MWLSPSLWYHKIITSLPTTFDFLHTPTFLTHCHNHPYHLSKKFPCPSHTPTPPLPCTPTLSTHSHLSHYRPLMLPLFPPLSHHTPHLPTLTSSHVIPPFTHDHAHTLPPSPHIPTVLTHSYMTSSSPHIPHSSHFPTLT